MTMNERVAQQFGALTFQILALQQQLEEAQAELAKLKQATPAPLHAVPAVNA